MVSAGIASLLAGEAGGLLGGIIDVASGLGAGGILDAGLGFVNKNAPVIDFLADSSIGQSLIKTVHDKAHKFIQDPLKSIKSIFTFGKDS